MESDLNPLALTRKLLLFDTTNPPGQERNCAQYLGKLLEAAGFQTNSYEFDHNRTSIIARLSSGGNKAPMCFTGHIDTVPLGKAAWRKNPFQGETDGDKIYGRGATDMKAGVAAMVLAALRLAKLPMETAGITLVFTAGEETCCQGAYHLAQLGNVLGEAGAIVVGEPTSNYPWIGHKGAVRFEIRTLGITAHASMPQLGDNAIHKAADAIIKLQNFDFQVAPHPVLGKPTLNIGTIHGGQNINSVPDQATIGIDIRTIPGQDHEEIRQRLQSHLGEEVEIRYLEQASSIATDHTHEWVQKLFDIMEPYLGERPVAAGASYFSDASVLTPAYGHPPTIILGPGEPTMAHKTDEFCFISKIEAATKAYTEIANQWCRCA